MKTIVVLLDSLNRHMLKLYNEHAWVKTPNIDRLAQKSIVFDNHWIGSAPCMPARRDMMTGRYSFIFKGWGGIEPFDVTLPSKLRENEIYTHIVTDHYHYFGLGGEGYCQLFNTWDLQRGQESDRWVSRVVPPALPESYYGQIREQYEQNRTEFIKEEDYPGPKTFSAACEWLDNNREADDFLLWVECFDPHEPFDCPKEYLDMYEDSYEGLHFNWSSYAPVTEPPEAVEHLRKLYAGLLTMTDHWLGKLLDKMDQYDLWEDTLLIFTTDHGHILGEHGFTGKNIMHLYNEIAHIPLMIHLPGSDGAGRRVNALTQNIDMMPTILDYHGIACPDDVHGLSWRDFLEGGDELKRDAVIYGIHGRAMNITDGNHTFFKSAESEDNYPCYSYTAMPVTHKKYLGLDIAGEIEMGRFLPNTNYPVYKIPKDGTSKKKVKGRNYIGQHIKDTLLFDLTGDYSQENPIKDKELEEKFKKMMKQILIKTEAPKEQFKRLGLD